VRLVVARLGGGEHEVLERGQITCEEGLVGDRWASASKPSRGRQLTLMEARVAELVANGQPLHLPGDNLLVDLDLSVDAAPTGTRLQIGTSLLVVTDKLHLGCKKFVARFGADANEWVNAPEHGERRMRGINCRVLEAGWVSPGDPAINLGPDQEDEGGR